MPLHAFTNMFCNKIGRGRTETGSQIWRYEEGDRDYWILPQISDICDLQRNPKMGEIYCKELACMIVEALGIHNNIGKAGRLDTQKRIAVRGQRYSRLLKWKKPILKIKWEVCFRFQQVSPIVLLGIPWRVDEVYSHPGEQFARLRSSSFKCKSHFKILFLKRSELCFTKFEPLEPVKFTHEIRHHPRDSQQSAEVRKGQKWFYCCCHFFLFKHVWQSYWILHFSSSKYGRLTFSICIIKCVLMCPGSIREYMHNFFCLFAW